MPCNLNHKQLGLDVIRGIHDAGSTPIEFNTIAIADGGSTSDRRATQCDGSLCVLRGNLAREGCTVKLTVGRTNHSRQRACSTTSTRASTQFLKVASLPETTWFHNEGPAGGPGMPEMAQITGAIVEQA